MREVFPAKVFRKICRRARYLPAITIVHHTATFLSTAPSLNVRFKRIHFPKICEKGKSISNKVEAEDDLRLG